MAFSSRRFEFVDLARELRDVQGLGPFRIDLGATLLRRQRQHVGFPALASPAAHGRPVLAVAAQHRTGFNGLRTTVGSGQDGRLSTFVTTRRLARPTTSMSSLIDAAGRIGQFVHCGHLLLD